MKRGRRLGTEAFQAAGRNGRSQNTLACTLPTRNAGSPDCSRAGMAQQPIRKRRISLAWFSSVAFPRGILPAMPRRSFASAPPRSKISADAQLPIGPIERPAWRLSARSLPNSPVADQHDRVHAPCRPRARRAARSGTRRQPIHAPDLRAAGTGCDRSSDRTKPSDAVAVHVAVLRRRGAVRLVHARDEIHRTQSACLRRNAGMSYVSTPFSCSA